MPNTDFLGISRKITDENTRNLLLEQADKMRENAQEGFIVRTQAPFATEEQLQTEVAYLKQLYADMELLSKTADVGALLYEDDDLPARVMRDSYGEDIDAIHVGDKELYERLLRLITLRKDIPQEKLVFHNGDRSMMKEYGISPLVYGAADPIVPLENGAHIVIEPTEAMTVVDVNTGSYTGDNSLEETVFAVNLAAAEEIARQVRLRNIGGIIVVDFIDMADEAHREAVTEKLREKLSLDKAKCNVLPMSELCITQFTRKRVGHDAHSYLVKPCPHCQGMAYVHEDIFVITRMRAHILDCFADGFSTAIVELNEGIMKKILDEGLLSVEAKTRWKNNKVYFVPHKTFKEDYFSVRGEKEENFTPPQKAQLLSDWS
jgi:ribonuclease G